MRESVVRDFLICPACRHETLEVAAFERRPDDADVVMNGVVACPACRAWYRLENELLELLVPAIQNPARRAAFRRRFADRWRDWPEPEARQAAGDAHKIGQREFYDEDVTSYETQMLRLPFWRGFDRTYREHIARVAASGGATRRVLLEVGGGTGRMSLPLASRFARVLSFDISEGMAREARRKRDALASGSAGRGKASLGHVEYFVADAENIPVRTGAADVVVFSGILHHVDSPDAVLRETARALAPDGRFIGLENNRSVFRPIFDLLMRFRKLWNEKASEEHFIISRADLEGWFAGAGFTGEIWTSVFLPPHVYNLLSDAGSERLLRVTDRIARLVPWLREQGGQILFAGRKADAPAADQRSPESDRSSASHAISAH